jgi:putative phage-type endonuclease
MITEQQRAERLLGIGGSDMAVILGLSTYKTPYQLYLEKVGEATPTEEESQYQYWGNQLEGIVRDEFAKRNNVTITTPETLVHPEHDFLRGNVDGFIPELNAVLEVKCSSQFMSNVWGESGSDEIPMQYLVQVAFYCMLTNADCAHIAVLIGGNDYREYKYIRDKALEDTIIKTAKRFWNCVVTKTPPAPINQVDLRLMYPQHDPEKTIPVTEEIKAELQVLAATKAKIKEFSDAEDKHKFNIMRFMQDAECLADAQGRALVSWKANKRGSRTFLVKGMQ